MSKRKRAKAEQRIKFWKLKKKNCSDDFREKLSQALVVVKNCQMTG